MSSDAVLLDVALIVAFAAGVLYWVFVTPKRERDAWHKQLDVRGRKRMPPAASAQPWDADVDVRRRR